MSKSSSFAICASSTASCAALRAEAPPPPPFGARPALGDAGDGGSAALSFPPLDFSLAESLDALALAAAPLPPALGEVGDLCGGIVVARQL